MTCYVLSLSQWWHGRPWMNGGSSPSSGAAMWCRGKQNGPGGCCLIQPPATDRDCNKSGLPVVCGYNTRRQSCSGLWLLRATGTCYGERRACAAYWGGCTPDLHADAPTGSAQVVPIHRKRTSVLPSFLLSFLRAKWKQHLLRTQRWGHFCNTPVPPAVTFFLSVTTPLQPPCLNQLLSPRLGRGPRFWRMLSAKKITENLCRRERRGGLCLCAKQRKGSSAVRSASAQC